MTKTDKRIEELERRVKELEAAPREMHIHYPFLPMRYVPDWTWRPAPPYQPYPVWYSTTAGQYSGTIPYNTNTAGALPATQGHTTFTVNT